MWLKDWFIDPFASLVGVEKVQEMGCMGKCFLCKFKPVDGLFIWSCGKQLCPGCYEKIQFFVNKEAKLAEQKECCKEIGVWEKVIMAERLQSFKIVNCASYSQQRSGHVETIFIRHKDQETAVFSVAYVDCQTCYLAIDELRNKIAEAAKVAAAKAERERLDAWTKAKMSKECTLEINPNAIPISAAMSGSWVDGRHMPPELVKKAPITKKPKPKKPVKRKKNKS